MCQSVLFSEGDSPPHSSQTGHKQAIYCFSVSARISKGQGYQGFLRKRAGSSFEKLEKFTEFHYF
jgi:hypothetical protein